jgi:predicted SAM-dependent methyltransferase
MNLETSKARERLAKYCVGNGIDLGYGGDPITPHAIAMDQPFEFRLTKSEGDHPQNLSGDARNLYWFNDDVLDFVYSSHLLEDFKAEETPIILKEWLRVVKPGGYLVLYGPDEVVYAEHCRRTGQNHNEAHSVPDFGLEFLKNVLSEHLNGMYQVVHEVKLIDDYCFDLVLRKKGGI